MELILDLSYLNEISDGDTDFIGSILTTFIEETPKDIANIKAAISANDIDQIGKLAHKNKSALQMMGLIELKELALNIEIAAKKDADNPMIITDANRFLQHLGTTIKIAEVELAKFV